MAIDAFVKPFLRLPLFQGLKPLQLTDIVRRADRVVYRPGDVLIEEDKPGDGAIVIISGEAARVAAGEEGAPAEIIPEGSIIAELAMLVETVHGTTVIAKSTVRALKITREDMHAQMAADTKLAEHMMARIGARLRRLADEVRAIDNVLAAFADRDLPARAEVAGSRHPLTATALH